MPKTQSKEPTSTDGYRTNRTNRSYLSYTSYLVADKSFDSDYHRIRAHQVFDSCFSKTCRAHPFSAVFSCVIKPTGSFDQHVQAHQQPESVGSPLVIDKRFKNDQCPACRKRLVGLFNQHTFLVKIPVVENVTHRDYVR